MSSTQVEAHGSHDGGHAGSERPRVLVFFDYA